MRVEVKVQTVRSSDGRVACALFDRADGFPSKQQLARHGLNLPAESGEMSFVFDDVQPGKYALTVLHDENGNGRLDTNLLGMPKEGYGVSNNAFRRFGPPRFHEAKIVINGPGPISVPLYYP